MTKEELKQEAEEYAKKNGDCFSEAYGIRYRTYIDSAEPREKRIIELEEINADLKQSLDWANERESEDVKRIKELEKENAELRKVAEFQQSSNMDTHFENKKLKEGLTVGSMWNKHLNCLNKELEEDRDRYRNMTFDQREQFTKAKEIISEYINILKGDTKNWKKTQEKAEQFISEVEK